MWVRSVGKLYKLTCFDMHVFSLNVLWKRNRLVTFVSALENDGSLDESCVATRKRHENVGGTGSARG